MSSNEGSTDIRKKGGRPAGKIWNYFEKGAQVSRGYNSAICSFCGYNWATAKPSRLKKHIAYDCQKIDSDTKIKVLTLLLVEHEDSDEDLNSTSITKRKTSQTDIDEDYENFPTSEDKEIAINKALVKLFDYSNVTRHTGAFFGDEIIKIVEEIGPEKLAAVVSDNAPDAEEFFVRNIPIF
ncbi:ribonuclease H-like domain-containing protein [Rhizophagus clarus]|uniref:Ribonuclease H-like domain-containing protein n=1 Tax=Rhizophagus clarus TaxID=94130 RepID=A0A8H3M259_9GLOM|nr:ribonuclease H-like domain-containing protein [Rhizophagus clarus]